MYSCRQMGLITTMFWASICMKFVWKRWRQGQNEMVFARCRGRCEKISREFTSKLETTDTDCRDFYEAFFPPVHIDAHVVAAAAGVFTRLRLTPTMLGRSDTFAFYIASTSSSSLLWFSAAPSVSVVTNWQAAARAAVVMQRLQLWRDSTPPPHDFRATVIRPMEVARRSIDCSRVSVVTATQESSRCSNQTDRMLQPHKPLLRSLQRPFVS